MSISKALEVISKNVYQNNRYSLNIKIPSLAELNGYQNNDFKEFLEFFVVDTNLPGIRLTLKEVIYLGTIKQTAINQNIDAITVLFYETKDQKLRQFFIDWINAIAPKNNRLKTLQYYPDEYKTSAEFILLEKKIQVKDMVPATIGDFSLSQNASNNLGTFTVSFKVKELNY